MQLLSALSLGSEFQHHGQSPADSSCSRYYYCSDIHGYIYEVISM